MRALKRKKGERRRGVRGAEFSGELGQGSDERFPRRGRLPWEVETSAGCTRERRSSEQDGEASGELRWPERATPTSACVRAVAEARLRVLYCHGLVGRQMRWSMRRQTRHCKCKRVCWARGPPGGQVSPSPAHGGHGASGFCCGRVRRAREREAWCEHGAGEAGLLALVGRKRGTAQ
jgi:hypothetical protein